MKGSAEASPESPGIKKLRDAGVMSPEELARQPVTKPLAEKGISYDADKEKWVKHGFDKYSNYSTETDMTIK